MRKNGRTFEGWLVRDENGQLGFWTGARAPRRQRAGRQVQRAGMIAYEYTTDTGMWVTNGDKDSGLRGRISSFDVPSLKWEDSPRRIKWHYVFEIEEGGR